MKRVIWAILFVFLLIGIGANVSAEELNKVNQDSSLNEYKELKKASKKSIKELKKDGYNEEDIKKIKNVEKEYVKHLKEYAKLDEKQLRKLGYTDKQVKIFKNYKGDEEDTISIAATLSFSLNSDYVTYSYSQNRTNARLVYNFYWNGVPFVKTTDIVGVSWNDWTLNGSHAFVTYEHIYGSSGNIYGYPALLANDGPQAFGRAHKFAMTQQDNYYWARSGQGTFTLYSNYGRKDLSAYAEYGHSTFSADPSFSIPGYGSIIFSYGVNNEAAAWEDAAVN